MFGGSPLWDGLKVPTIVTGVEPDEYEPEEQEDVPKYWSNPELFCNDASVGDMEVGEEVGEPSW